MVPSVHAGWTETARASSKSRVPVPTSLRPRSRGGQESNLLDLVQRSVCMLLRSGRAPCRKLPARADTSSNGRPKLPRASQKSSSHWRSPTELRERRAPGGIRTHDLPVSSRTCVCFSRQGAGNVSPAIQITTASKWTPPSRPQEQSLTIPWKGVCPAQVRKAGDTLARLLFRHGGKLRLRWDLHPHSPSGTSLMDVCMLFSSGRGA